MGSVGRAVSQILAAAATGIAFYAIIAGALTNAVA